MAESQNAAKILKKIIMISLSISLALIFTFAITSCGTSADYTDRDSGKAIELKNGDKITVKLKSNPTTGYCWNITDDMDHSIVSLLSSEYKQTKKAEKLVGSGGFEYFTFKAESAGSTDIVLNYMRPWEEDEEPSETFKLSVTVR